MAYVFEPTPELDWERMDAHDYGEYEPDFPDDEDDDGDDDWYAEEGEDFLRREVYEPLGRRLRDGSY